MFVIYDYFNNTIFFEFKISLWHISKEAFALANEIAGAISKILCEQNFASDGVIFALCHRFGVYSCNWCMVRLVLKRYLLLAMYFPLLEFYPN